MGKYRHLEQAERVALVAKFEATAQEIAAKLGGDWTARFHADAEIRREGLIYLCNKGDGRRITLGLRLSEHPVKIEVYGNYETGPDYLGLRGVKNNLRPSVSVSLDRPSDALARDIARRFLPDYTALFGEIGRMVATHQAAWDARAGAARRLCALSDGKMSGPHEWRGSGFEGRVWSQHDGGGVSIDLKVDNLNEVQAAAVVRLVRTFNEGGS
jgi:hypothetical protein